MERGSLKILFKPNFFSSFLMAYSSLIWVAGFNNKASWGMKTGIEKEKAF